MRYRPIRRNSEFGRVYARGKSYVNPALVLYVLKTPRLKSWQLSEVVARLFAQAGLPDKAKQPDAKPPATVPPADRAAKQ